MINKIIDLSQTLRKEGFPVSIRTTESAINVYRDLNNVDNDLLKAALRSVYVKDKYDLAKFNKIFDNLFKKIEKQGSSDQRKSGSVNFKLADSNRYVIKKNSGEKNSKERMEYDSQQLIKQLSGTPLLEENSLEREGEILNKDLTKLNKFDPRVLILCQKLGRKIANKRSRRAKIDKSHRIDIRRTIRANLKYGGVPLEIVKAKPRPYKNEHFFLNDISGSCEWISSWFFMLVFSAQTAFKRSRTFEFDNKTIETTNALNEEYLINAFAKVREKRVKNAMVHGTSNMYTAFDQFIKKANLNNKSYVIILSDCRDWAGPKVDGVQASADLIEKMVQDSKKVIILNPENRIKWDIVDSCVSLYQDAGAQVFEVNTLTQLAKFVESL